MNKKMAAVMLLVLLIAGCSLQLPRNEEGTSEVSQEEAIIVAESTDKSVRLEASVLNLERGMIEEITVHINDKQQAFNWENSINPSFYPNLYVEDLDEDGQKEMIVIATIGHGTGVLELESHVLKADFTEIEVQDPLQWADFAVDSSLELVDGTRKYFVTVAGQTYSFAYDESEDGIWFDDVMLGNIVHYRIENGTFIAEVSVQVGGATFPGALNLYYSYMDGKLEVASVAFIPV